MYVWIILILIIFMLHNLEEIITIEKWFHKTYPQVKKRIPASVQSKLEKTNMTSAKFSVIVFVLSIFVSALIIVDVMKNQNYLFLGINLFFCTQLQSLYLRCYTPGVSTSLLLVIPYYCLFFYDFYNNNLLTTRSILCGLIVALLLIPVFLIRHKVGEKWGHFTS